MTLDQAVVTIQSKLARMDELYGKRVFDEWAVVAVYDRKGRILHYDGPRREDLLETFAGDIRHFAPQLVAATEHLGHFEFSPDAGGAQYDAFVVVGDGCYLICNNTAQSMAGITKEPRWLQAQVPFAELSDVFRSDPLVQVG